MVHFCLAKEKQPTQLQKIQGYLSFYLKKVAFSNLSIHLEDSFLEYLAFLTLSRLALDTSR